jgi:hypothetical protein
MQEVAHGRRGFGRDVNKKSWIHDKVSALIIDIPISIQSSVLDYQIEFLQLVIAEEYEKQNCAQEEVWVSVHQIMIRIEKTKKKNAASP